jgi:hypothetical protein
LTSKNRAYLRLLLEGRVPEGNIADAGAGIADAAPPTAGSHVFLADPSRAAMLAFAFFLLAPLPWVIVYFLPPLNHDSAALLHYAQRWLAGERLYVDLIDVNPPLVFVLDLLPAAIARLTPISAAVALNMCVIAWIGFSFALCWRLLRVVPGSVSGIHRYLLPPLLLFLMIVYPGSEFTQREHLMIVATLPYLLLAQARIERRETVSSVLFATTLFAGIAFALKPHFLLIPLMVEAMVAASLGWRRAARDPVPWTLAAIMIAYGGFILFVTPSYLTVVVPLAMESYVGLGDRGPWGVMFDSQLTPSVMLLVPLAIASLYMRRPLGRIVALAAIAATVIALVQGKGWPYHVLPTESFVLLLAAVLLSELLDSQVAEVHERRSLSLMVFLVALMLGVYYLSALTRPTFWRQAQFDDSAAGQLLQRFGKQASEGPVLILSPGIYPHFPLVNYAKTKMATRFMSLWPIQGAYPKCLPDGRMFRNPSEMSFAESFAYHAVAEDFNRNRPKLVIVDKEPGIIRCGSEDFDYLAYFRRNRLFEANWQRYRLLAEYDRYRVYVRR